MKSITDWANASGTDKGTRSGAAHSYSLIYDMLLPALRAQDSVNILELGLAIGGPELSGDINRKVSTAPSVEMWLNFFPTADVTGFDISDFSEIERDRFQFIRGDAGKREDLEKITATGKTFDVVLDDASHASFHQQLSLAVLFKSVAPGGLFIIEDLGWQPREIEKSLPTVPKTSQVLADFLTRGTLTSTAALPNEDAQFIAKETSAILLFDESYLNNLGDSYNRRNGLAPVLRSGWRGATGMRRALNPYFWLFSARRLSEGLAGAEAVNSKSIKLAIIQRAS